MRNISVCVSTPEIALRDSLDTRVCGWTKGQVLKVYLLNK